MLTEYTATAARAGVERPVRMRAWLSSDVFLFGLSAVALLALWELLVRGFQIREIILPGPLAIGRALVTRLSESPLSTHSIYYHFWVTFSQAVAGYVVGSALGIGLGIMVSQFKLFERLLLPYLIGLQGVPKVAIAPLFIVWFGFGFAPKFGLALISTFFPVTINSLAGFKSVEPERIEMMRSIGASRWQIFSLMSLPSALPFIFAGLEIASAHAMLATLVGEFVGASAGLGFLLRNVNQSLDVSTEFAVLLVLAAVGIGLYRLLGYAKRHILFWAPEVSAMRRT